MPHTAYNINLPKNLSFVIESMRAFGGDNLIVGTKQGHLLMYKNESSSYVNSSGSPPSEIKMILLKTNRTLKKPIVQLEVVPELSLLVVLSGDHGGSVTVHDIDHGTNFPIVTTVLKTGCSAFALDISRQKSLTGELSFTLRLAAAITVKKKSRLLLFYWKNRKFHEFLLHPPEEVGRNLVHLELPDVPKTLAWCKQSICIGLKHEYVLIKLSPSGFQQTQLFSCQEPNVYLLPDAEGFALAKDSQQTVFIGLDGAETTLKQLDWPQPTTRSSIVVDLPYVLSLQPNGVAVKSYRNNMMVQTMNLISKPSLICSCTSVGMVYVASASHLWFFKMVSISKQVEQLVVDKQFELVIELLRSQSGSEDEILEMKIIFAFDLFCRCKKFKESLDLLFDLNVDTSHVIGLYGNLLPRDFQDTLTYPSQLPRLEETEEEEAVRDLIEYLTKVRQRLKKIPSPLDAQIIVPIARGCCSVKGAKGINEIVDTTLVKCYLKVEDRQPLLASLLRLKDNQCHLKETESVLKKHQKFEELAILYNTRGHHRKALELLKKHSESWMQKTVRYLQNLHAKHIELICEYSLPVIKTFPKDGLSIFASDLANVEEWPRDKVLDFLMKNEKSVVIEYLEFIIQVWQECNPLFHNMLVIQYKDTIVEEVLSIKSASGDGCQHQNAVQHADVGKGCTVFEHNDGDAGYYPEAATQHAARSTDAQGTLDGSRGAESSDVDQSTEEELSGTESSSDQQQQSYRRLDETRTKIRAFLQTSTCFLADIVLPQFPTDRLFEERALLLGSLGRHTEALALYLHKVHDTDAALKYCQMHYSPTSGDRPSDRVVYATLYRLLMQSPKEIAQIRQLPWLTAEVEFVPDIDGGLGLLDAFPSRIDIGTVLDATPSSVSLERISPYLTSTLEKRVAQKHQTQLMRALMHAEHLGVQEERIRTESQRVTLTESDVCQICHRRFRSQVAFVRLHNGNVIHYSCKNKAAIL